MGRILGHELGELVHLAERHFKHPADVAQDAARQERAEGDDLRHAVGAVALAHVSDHFVATVLTEVDVEIGHRDAFGIEEPLEQEAKPQRIEIGDGERPGDDRARARTAPRTDWDALRLRPLDEVGDDKKIAGELHVDDDVELEGEALGILLLGASRGQPMRGKACAQALARLTPKLVLLVKSRAASDRKARQDRFSRQRPIGAAHCDLDAGLGRLGEIGEQFGHLRARLEPMLRRQAPAVGHRHHRAFGDAEQRVMRFIVRRPGEIGFVGRDQGQADTIGERDELRLGCAFAVEPVALDLDIEPRAENVGQALEPALRQVAKSGSQRPVDRPARTAGERD